MTSEAFVPSHASFPSVRRSFRYTPTSGNSNDVSEDASYVRRVARRFEKAQQKRAVVDPSATTMIRMVETFLRRTKRMCYGGTAVNNILPPRDRFYDRTRELPDYDCFSPDALRDAKSLADTFYRRGFAEVEAKAGFHVGTYKVFVNFVPVADITQMDPVLYRRLKRDALVREGIVYAPPNFLRMAMYLELSRPMGDVSRWEKVYRRLRLLDRHHPLVASNCGTSEPDRSSNRSPPTWWKPVQNLLVREKVVFFGREAMDRMGSPNVPPTRASMDVLATNAAKVAEKVARVHPDPKARVQSRPAVGEYVPPRFEVWSGRRLCVTVYQTQACYAYVETKVDGRSMRLANVETMMSLFLAMQYVPGCGKACAHRIACLCAWMFRTRQRRPIQKRGLLQTFPSRCYGTQKTFQTVRREKTKKYRELKRNPRGREYETWFLRYVPMEHT